jgi:hypothetical protein
MPWEFTWITARQVVCSDGGDSVPVISTLGTNAFDDRLASEEDV